MCFDQEDLAGFNPQTTDNAFQDQNSYWTDTWPLKEPFTLTIGFYTGNPLTVMLCHHCSGCIHSYGAQSTHWGRWLLALQNDSSTLWQRACLKQALSNASGILATLFTSLATNDTSMQQVILWVCLLNDNISQTVEEHKAWIFCI